MICGEPFTKSKQERKQKRTECLPSVCDPNRKQPLTRPLRISRVSRKKTKTERLISFGMPKCVSEKLLPVINWLKKWVGKKYWCSPSNLPLKMLGKKIYY